MLVETVYTVSTDKKITPSNRGDFFMGYGMKGMTVNAAMASTMTTARGRAHTS